MSMLALSCLAVVSVVARMDPDLGPGSPAPKLEVKEWVRGDAIPELEKNQTYVVEFWATWCGPCIENIPHVTELAKKYGKVHFLGISVLEDNDKQQVQKFVTKMGDKMDYTVGYSGNKDGMAKSWLSAAKQNGIPAAFIVKDGTVMWIGHPAALDAPLAKIDKNEFDVAGAKKTFEASLAARAAREKRQARLDECSKLFDAGDVKAAKDGLAEVEQTPEGKAAAESLRFRWLCVEDAPAWRTKVTEQMDKSQDHGDSLSMFIDENALRAPEHCRWLADQLTTRYADNWYPSLCTARMYRKQKEFDKALSYSEKSRQVILDFRRKNPDAPEGNALDVIKALEDQIKSEKGN